MQSSSAPQRHLPIRKDWLAATQEPALEPDRPIIDPHHHLWDRPGNRYLFHDLMEDLNSGHNIRATVFLECREMYRAEGPPELRSLGETQFVAGVSAMSESGKYGPARACAGHYRQCRFPRRQPRQGHPRTAHHHFRRALPRHPQRRDLARATRA